MIDRDMEQVVQLALSDPESEDELYEPFVAEQRDPRTGLTLTELGQQVLVGFQNAQSQQPRRLAPFDAARLAALAQALEAGTLQWRTLRRGKRPTQKRDRALCRAAVQWHRQTIACVPCDRRSLTDEDLLHIAQSIQASRLSLALV